MSHRKERIREMVLSLNAMFPEVNLQVLHQAVIESDLDESLAIEKVLLYCDSQNIEVLDENAAESLVDHEESKELSEHDEEEEECYDDQDLEEEQVYDEEMIYEEDFGDDSAFVVEEPTRTEKEEKAPKQYFKILGFKELLQDQEVEVKQVAETIQLKSTIFVEVLLKHYRWNSEKLIRDYGEYGMSYLLEKCGLSNDVSGDQNQIGMCDACYSDDVKLFSYDMCGHTFCYNCWKDYISTFVTENSFNHLNIKCMAYGCKSVLTETYMMSFLDQGKDAELINRFYKAKVDSYVADHFRLKWCPNPKCGRVIKKLCDENLFYVQCKCGEECCFHCDKEPHFPCPCSVYAKFIDDVKNETASMQLIKKSCQQCPKCKTYVFKNVGCDHINCVCGNEFCYRCGGDFTGYRHDYEECMKHDIKNVDLDHVEFEFSIVETLYHKISQLWKKHRDWLDEQKTSQHYQLLIDNTRIHTEYTIFSDDDFKFLNSTLKTVIRSRRLLRSCYVYAFMYFGFDKVKLEKKALGQFRNDFKKEVAALETYGLLFDSHLQRLETFVSQLLVNLDLTLNTKQRDKAIFLEMTNKTNLVTKEQQNIVDFINNRMLMKEISYE